MRWMFSLLLLTGFASSVAAAENKAGRDYSQIVLADEPVAYWRFEETGSGKVFSSVPPENRDVFVGTTVGSVSLGQLGPRPRRFPGFDSGNRAAEFSGRKDFIRVADPGDASPLDFQNGDSITLEAWVNLRELRNEQNVYVIGKGRTGNSGAAAENQNYALRLRGQSGAACVSFLFRSRSDGKGSDAKNFHRWTSDVGFPPDSGWHHIAVSYTFGTPSSMTGFLDGRAVGGSWDMAGATEAAPVVDNDEVWIGSALGGNGGNSFHGWMDEIAIHRRALSAERIAARFQVEEVSAPPLLTATQLPDDAAIIQLFSGLPDRTWSLPLESPALEYREPLLTLLDVPRHYNARGVMDDRPLPLLVRAQMKRTTTAGDFTFLLRSHNAARLYVDDKLVAENKFLETNGDGHEAVPTLPEPRFPGMHPLPQGHQEKFETATLSAGPHVVRLDLIVGGKKLRPETGEVLVAIAEVGKPFSLLTPDGITPLPLTEEAWPEIVQATRQRMTALNARLRQEAAEKENEYWTRRHELARKLVAETATSPVAMGQIDDFITARAKTPERVNRPLSDDASFLRRITLDIIGLAPTRDELRAFIADSAEDKRQRAIDRLLQDPRWADNWVGYWQDVLAENPGIVKPEQNNTGPFRWWIHESLSDNKPFDRFVTELVMMEGSKQYGGPAGFGMASQNDAPLAAKAQILTTAFLGLEMKCARCHDAPHHSFKQQELFSLAAMLNRDALTLPKSSTVPLNPDGREPLITVSLKPGDRLEPTWDVASLPLPPLPDGILRNANDARERFAAILTSPTNSRFAEMIVNRLWKRYLGWGIVEPVDDWEGATPLAPELLNFLARELVSHNYDLKHVARLIFNARVYQTKSLTAGELTSARRDGIPTGPAQRRLTAEQLVDSLFSVTGKSLDVEMMTLDPEGRRPIEQFMNLGVPTRAWQLASTSTDRDRPALIMPATQQVADVLMAYGWRDARPSPQTERDESPSPVQGLVLANGLSATRLARLSDDHAITQIALEERPLSQFVQELFLQVLSRSPTSDEQTAVTAILEAGYAERRREAAKVSAARPNSQKRNAVSWANHLRSEATRIKLELEQEILAGDRPTERLASDWRERLEDVTWALLNSPEFAFVP